MVSNVSGTSSYQYQVGSSETSKLTDEQKKKLQELLSKYDPENMTEETTKSMMDEIKSAGIKPSKEFGQIMNDAGFKPPEKVRGSGTDDAQTSAGSTDVADELQSIISQFSSALLNALNETESTDSSQTDLSTLIEQLKSYGKSQGALVDQKV